MALVRAFLHDAQFEPKFLYVHHLLDNLGMNQRFRLQCSTYLVLQDQYQTFQRFQNKRVASNKADIPLV